MSFGDVLRSIIEIAVVFFVVWALFHEERFADFEEKLFCRFRRKKLKLVKQNYRSDYERI